MKKQSITKISLTAIPLACLLSTPLAAQNGNGNGNGSSSTTTTNTVNNGNGTTTTNTTTTTTTTTSSSSTTTTTTPGSTTVIQNLVPLEPAGILSAYPTIVQTGTKPTINWNIIFPTSVNDTIIINPPGEIITQANNTYVSVQIVGTSTTDCTEDTAPSKRFADARISINGSTFTQLFYGTSSEVTPQYSLYVKRHTKGTRINFGGRYVKNNNWTPFYTTNSSNMQVVTLRNGDTIPTSFALHTSPQLASYLVPYLNANGTVKLGPQSVLVMMELGSRDRNSPCFDYQDVVLLVSFTTKHPNNGHGNNLDGVDSSNPGRGKGGPTGLNNTGQDPSGGVDDEGKVNGSVIGTVTGTVIGITQ